MIDTGASLCMVDEAVIKSFGLPPFGTQTMNTASGTVQQATYPAALSFPGTTLPNLAFVDFVAGPLAASGIVAIIGRSVLRWFVLVYNGPGGSVTQSYWRWLERITSVPHGAIRQAYRELLAEYDKWRRTRV